MLTCPNCGEIVMNGDSYCPNCGTTFRWSHDSDEDDRKPLPKILSNLNSPWYTFHIYYDNGYLIAKIMNGSTEVFSYEDDVSNVISFDSFYPAIMIYDYGGAMLFDKVLLEPWSSD